MATATNNPALELSATGVAAQIASSQLPTPSDLEPVPFAVDAALLRELGERLVGRPYIALGELIKNSYDADAGLVEIFLRDDKIILVDDGHGMTDAEFKNRWMRVGSPHKARELVSRRLKRPLTGSKGIGRLAVQFLGNDLQLWTRADRARASKLFAKIDWDTARREDLLTQATAQFGRVPGREPIQFAGGSRHGTVIEITDLNQEWNHQELTKLGQEIWMLRPPFAPASRAAGFDIALEAEDPAAIKLFDDQITAYLDVAYATVKASLEEDRGAGLLRGVVRFRDGEQRRFEHRFPGLVAKAEIEVRVYDIHGRQPRGLKVDDLRRYFSDWGGVHIYDGGFRLPYYGSREQDWLGIERDHAHRLSTGATLVPASEQVTNGLRFLPTTSRIFGQVSVSTQEERRKRAGAGVQSVLQIQASRDRLVDNEAFQTLKKAVRYALDYYAFSEAARRAKRSKEEHVPTAAAVEQLAETADRVSQQLKPHDARDLRAAVEAVFEAEKASARAGDRQMRLLATLASAGASSLAYEHEVGKQLGRLDEIASQLDRRARVHRDLKPLAEDLGQWVDRANRARSLFAPLLNDEQREAERALPALGTVRGIVEDLDFILQGVPVEVGVPAEMVLPRARYAEWAAMFQNAFANSIAALRGTPEPRLAVVGGKAGRAESLRVLDNGAGIDLDRSEEYFEPFERGSEGAVGPGSGLGLAIIRTLAGSIGINVRFVDPPEGWSTCLRISWRRSRS